MELIIGGAYQGKLTYAVSRYGFAESELCDLKNGPPSSDCRCLYHLEEWVRGNKLPARELFDLLAPYMGDCVIICREVGSGIVPLDADERSFREECGSLLRLLAEKASHVTRIFCGLPEVLK